MVLASPAILKEEILSVCDSANNLSPSFEGGRLMTCWLTSPFPLTRIRTVCLCTWSQAPLFQTWLRGSVGEIKKAAGCVGWEGFTSGAQLQDSVSPNPRCSGHPVSISSSSLESQTQNLYSSKLIIQAGLLTPIFTMYYPEIIDPESCWRVPRPCGNFFKNI